MILNFLRNLFVKPDPETPLEDWSTPKETIEAAEAALLKGAVSEARDSFNENRFLDAENAIKNAQNKIEKLRKADYIDLEGNGRVFSSKTPDPTKLSWWVGKTREELRIAKSYAFANQKHGLTYKYVANVFPKELATWQSFERMPLLTARIVQIKRMTRGGNRAKLKPRKAAQLDRELATLRSMARNISFACEWVNSQLALCVYLDKKFGDRWNEQTAVAIIKAVSYIRFGAVS